MGQSITVQSRPADTYCIFSTDRVLTGQDGLRFASFDEAEGADGFPAQLAALLFSTDEAIDNVYVAGNDVIVGRNATWETAGIDAAAATISDLYRFYD